MDKLEKIEKFLDEKEASGQKAIQEWSEIVQKYGDGDGTITADKIILNA